MYMHSVRCMRRERQRRRIDETHSLVEKQKEVAEAWYILKKIRKQKIRNENISEKIECKFYIKGTIMGKEVTVKELAEVIPTINLWYPKGECYLLVDSEESELLAKELLKKYNIKDKPE